MSRWWDLNICDVWCMLLLRGTEGGGVSVMCAILGCAAQECQVFWNHAGKFLYQIFGRNSPLCLEVANSAQFVFLNYIYHTPIECKYKAPGADKSLARPGRKQVWKNVRDARDFNDMETRSVIKLFFLQGKLWQEIHAILTGTFACFILGRGKDLSAPL